LRRRLLLLLAVLRHLHLVAGVVVAAVRGLVGPLRRLRAVARRRVRLLLLLVVLGRGASPAAGVRGRSVAHAPAADDEARERREKDEQHDAEHDPADHHVPDRVAPVARAHVARRATVVALEHGAGRDVVLHRGGRERSRSRRVVEACVCVRACVFARGGDAKMRCGCVGARGRKIRDDGGEARWLCVRVCVVVYVRWLLSMRMESE
jgi:hypothetical protein